MENIKCLDIKDHTREMGIFCNLFAVALNRFIMPLFLIYAVFFPFRDHPSLYNKIVIGDDNFILNAFTVIKRSSFQFYGE